MRYIKEYSSFIGEEWSKNEPIPEILDRPNGLAIFLIGAPGIGKSTFVNRFIHPKNPNIKDFSTDDISLLYTKDPNVYYKGREKAEGGRTSNASQLNLKKMKLFMTTGNSFIYDTTGAGKEYTDTGFEHVKEIFDMARENRYEIVFIHLLSTLQTSIDQDKLRDRHVDPHYIQWAYAKQMGGQIDGQKVEGNLNRYKALNPDSYYVVLSIDRKYTFMKFVDGRLSRRKGDRYVPIKESASDGFGASDILHCIQDLIDEGYSIRILDSDGNFAYPEDIYKKRDRLSVIKEHAHLVRAHFKIEIAVDTFEKLNSVFSEMYLANERLKEEGFALVDLKLEKQDKNEPNEIKFSRITYVFERPDQKLERGDADLKSIASKEYIESLFDKFGIDIVRIDYGDEEISVEIDPPVDASTGDYMDIEDDVHQICVAIGALSYDIMDRENIEFSFK